MIFPSICKVKQTVSSYLTFINIYFLLLYTMLFSLFISLKNRLQWKHLILTGRKLRLIKSGFHDQFTAGAAGRKVNFGIQGHCRRTGAPKEKILKSFVCLCLNLKQSGNLTWSQYCVGLFQSHISLGKIFFSMRTVGEWKLKIQQWSAVFFSLTFKGFIFYAMYGYFIYSSLAYAGYTSGTLAINFYLGCHQQAVMNVVYIFF